MATEPAAVRSSGPTGGPTALDGVDVGAADASCSARLATVPADPWARVRIASMCVVAVAYAWFTRTQGLITDRISVSIAIAIFVVAAFVGAPLRRWAQLALDALAYAALWYAYESTRGAADELGMPLQLEAVRDLDGFLFAGTQPTEWVQRAWYEPGVVHWYDAVLSLVYYSHFVVPAVAVAVVWATSRTMWVRFMRRLATVVGVACVSFVVVPTVPPWMASDPRFGFGVGEPLVRHVRSGIVELGFGGFARDWDVARGWSNPVAAMPSLHAAFSLLVVVFVAPIVRNRWLRTSLFAYPLTMAVALVYFAEHWVVDVVAGWLLVAAAFALWSRLERRGRRSEVERAAADLRIPAPDAVTASRRWSAVRDPDVVLIDRSFIVALTDPASPHHGAATARYARLLPSVLDDRVRLVARADHLSGIHPDRRGGTLAPVRPVHVASQHRRQADRWSEHSGIGAAARHDVAPPDLLTLVVARRSGASDVLVA